ncbi:MAG TPA: hypothetical protein DEQ09_06745, partial [Bacteroidales bacterium]|nr:hypothetical protein [Bacteroidales bacterium]
MDLFKALHRSKLVQFLKRRNLIGIFSGFFDILAITLAFQVSYSINHNNWGTSFINDSILLHIYYAIMPAWLIFLYIIKISEIPRTKRYRMLFWGYLQSALLIGLLLVFIYFIFRLYMVPRRVLAMICIFGFTFLFLLRFFEYKVLKIYRSRGYNQKNIVIISDATAIPFIESLREYPEWGYNIQTIFTESAEVFDKTENTIITLPGMFLRDLHHIIEYDHIDEVIG